MIVNLPKIEIDETGYLKPSSEYAQFLNKLGFVTTSTGKWALGIEHEFTEDEIFKIYGGWFVVEPVKELTHLID